MGKKIHIWCISHTFSTATAWEAIVEFICSRLEEAVIWSVLTSSFIDTTPEWYVSVIFWIFDPVIFVACQQWFRTIVVNYINQRINDIRWKGKYYKIPFLTSCLLAKEVWTCSSMHLSCCCCWDTTPKIILCKSLRLWSMWDPNVRSKLWFSASILSLWSAMREGKRRSNRT